MIDPRYDNEQNFAIIKQLIGTQLPAAKIKIFGSRAEGHYRKYSDFDILIDNGAPIDTGKLDDLRMAFSESMIPVRVDLVDRHTADNGFVEQIEKQAIEI